MQILIFSSILFLTNISICFSQKKHVEIFVFGQDTFKLAPIDSLYSYTGNEINGKVVIGPRQKGTNSISSKITYYDYKDGIKHKVVSYYYWGKNKFFERYFIRDSMYKFTSYYATGQIEREYYEIKPGINHGLFQKWYMNGNLHTSGYFKNGWADSLWTFYYPNGKIESDGCFLGDSSYAVKYFILFEYPEHSNDSGVEKINRTIYEKHSSMDGIWKFYNKEGQLCKIARYNKGIKISEKIIIKEE